MPDLVNCFLRLVYVYSWLLGLRNFDMDFNTGKTWTTRSGTFFAAVINILWFSLLPIQIFLYDPAIKRAQVLYDYVFMLMSMIRIVGVFIVLLIGWLRRCQIRVLVHLVSQLIVAKQQVKDVVRSRILWKIICTLVSEILHFYVAYLLYVKIGAIYSLILIGISTSIINLLSSQLCFLLLIIRTQYELLNADLRDILDELHAPHQPLYRYYNLADRINNITRMQHYLITLTQRIFQIFEVQGFCVICINFLTSIASIHFTYTAYKYGHDRMSLTLVNLIMIFIWGIIYHIDGIFNVYISLALLDTRAEMISLMAHRLLFPLELDKRIDAALESLQLQLTCQPLKFSLLGLFTIERRNAVLVGNALVVNAIFLIQYDIANYI